MAPRITEEQQQQIVERIKAGDSIPAIAEAVGRPVTTVSFIARILGLLKRQPSLAEEHKAQIVERYRRGDLVEDIAREVGFAKSHIG